MPSLRSRTRLLRGAGVALLIASAWFLPGCDEDDVERQLGNASAYAIERTYPINRDPLLNRWCEEIGDTLTAFGTRQQVPYTFKIVDTDMVNAFAAPYGHVYVTQGLLDFVGSEDEVITVMGHEIGHVIHRDGIKDFKATLLFNLAAGLITGEDQQLGDVAGLGFGLLSMHYSRVAEYHADDAGAALAYRAAYHPGAMLDFFDRLHRQIEKGRPYDFLDALLATHPYTVNRGLRQESKSFVALTTAPARLRVAQGYLRRGQYAHAAQLLQPESGEEDLAQVLLRADALAGRGALDEARAEYQLVSSISPYARSAVSSLAGRAPALPVPPSAAERTAAAALLDRALAVRADAEAALTALPAQTHALTRALSGPRAVSDRALRRLTDLSVTQTDLPRWSRQPVLRANAAVTRAADALYSLERYEESLPETLALTRQGATESASYLQTLFHGAGQTGALPLVKGALFQLEQAHLDQQRARQAAEASLKSVREAQDLAASTAEVVADLLHSRRQDSHLLFLTRSLAEDTRKQADRALEATGAAQRLSRQAALRSLLASLQLLQAQADPSRLPGLDRLVAHYLQTTPGQVASLRAQGLAYGDIGLVLSLAASTGAAPGTVLDGPRSGPSLIDSVTLDKHQISGLKVLLRFLARAMRQELGLPADVTLPA